MKCLLSKDSLQRFVFKEGNKPDRSKLEKTEKTNTPKKSKHFRGFLGFLNCIKQFISNYGTLKYTHTSLKRTLTKGSQF